MINVGDKISVFHIEAGKQIEGIVVKINGLFVRYEYEDAITGTWKVATTTKPLIENNDVKTSIDRGNPILDYKGLYRK